MSWTFGPHGPIESLDDGLWLVQAPLPHQAMSRTCTVARMSDGRLVIHSAIAMDEASMATLESWGEPAFLIVPGGMHRMDAPAFKDRYPGLTVLCPAGARQKVEQVVTKLASSAGIQNCLYKPVVRQPGARNVHRPGR